MRRAGQRAHLAAAGGRGCKVDGVDEEPELWGRVSHTARICPRQRASYLGFQLLHELLSQNAPRRVQNGLRSAGAG